MVFLYFLSISFFLLLCVLLAFFILIQESKTTGFGAAFGGEGADSLFGTSTADVLKQITGWLSVLFLFSCLFLSLWTKALSEPIHMPLPEEVMTTEEARS